MTNESRIDIWYMNGSPKPGTLGIEPDRFLRVENGSWCWPGGKMFTFATVTGAERRVHAINTDCIRAVVIVDGREAT